MEASGKRKIFWLITCLMPVIFIIVLEVILRWRGYGENLELAFTQDIQGKKYYTVNSSVSRRYFPSHDRSAPKVYDDNFEFLKSPNTYRIFCIGESTMQGFPFEYNAALPVLFKDRLIDRFQNKKIEVINLGITAINSYAVRDLVSDVVAYQPDLIIVYTGHNEFYGSFGVGSVEYFGTNRMFVNTYLKLQRFKIVQLLRNAMTGVRALFGSKPAAVPNSSLMELMAREKQIPYKSELYETAKENFRENLNDIVSTARSSHADIMLSTVVSNLHDQDPFVSEFLPTVSDAQKEQWQSFVEQGKKLSNDARYQEALEMFWSAFTIDSMRADLNYYIAGCLEGLKDSVGAKQYYGQARDYDCLRFRASGEFNSVIRDVAAANDIMLADIEKSFERQSPQGIVGNDLLYEHVHPTIDGYSLIAKEFAQTMQAGNCVVPSDKWRPPMTEEFYMYVSMLTVFDLEVSFLRIDHLRHQWPFSAPDSERYQPTTGEGNLAKSYLLGQMTWEQAHYQLAEIYKRQNDLPKAEREYLALAKEFWYDYRPLISAGDLNMSLKNYKNAEQYFRAALDREDNQFTQVRMGALCQELNQPQNAAPFYKTALEIDASAKTKFKKEWKLQIMLHLAQVYKQLEEYDKASMISKEALALEPKFQDALQLLMDIEAQRMANSAAR